MCVFGQNGLANFLAFVASQIVHDDGVAGAQLRRQALAHIGSEDPAIHGAVEDQRRDDAVVAQAGDKGCCPPMAVRCPAGQALPAKATTMASDHVGLGPGLVDEDQAFRVQTMLIGQPSHARRRHVRAQLLVGENGFF